VPLVAFSHAAFAVPVNCGTVYQRVVEPRTKSIAIINGAYLRGSEYYENLDNTNDDSEEESE
jgi:hypothetical protein